MEKITVLPRDGGFVASWRGFEAEGSTERAALWNLLNDYGEALGLTLSTEEMPADFTKPVILPPLADKGLDQPQVKVDMTLWASIPWSADILD